MSAVCKSSPSEPEIWSVAERSPTADQELKMSNVSVMSEVSKMSDNVKGYVIDKESDLPLDLVSGPTHLY